MNSRKLDQLEKEVERAAAAETAAGKALDKASQLMSSSQTKAGETATGFDVVGYLATEHRKAKERLLGAKAALEDARQNRRLSNSKNSLTSAAESDAWQRDDLAKRVRVGVNKTGAAIIGTSVGILVARAVSESAQVALVWSIRFAAISGALFAVEWLIGMLWSHVVAGQRRSAAKKLTDPDEALPAYGKVRDAVVRNAPWMLTVAQAALVTLSGAFFVHGVVDIAETLRASGHWQL